MIKVITSFLKKPSSLYAEVKLDHVELSTDHLIIGAKITWENTTPEPVTIQNMAINLFRRGNKEPFLHLIYNSRFLRLPYQKRVDTIARLNSFPINAGSKRLESLRFIARDVTDLNLGSYSAEFHSTVSEGTYIHDFDLEVIPEIKYHLRAFR
jgi:hypothetical protein